MKKTFLLSVRCVVCLFACFFVDAKAQSTETGGSVLIFPVYNSTLSAGLDTDIYITNTKPTGTGNTQVGLSINFIGKTGEPLTFSYGGTAYPYGRVSTYVQPGGTIHFKMSTTDPDFSGYVVVVALNAIAANGTTYQPIKHNYLKGVEVIDLKSAGETVSASRFTLPAHEIKKISSTPVSFNADGYSANLAFDGTDYEMLPRQVQASALPSLQYSGNTQFAYTDAYLFQPTSDATATVTSNFRVRNLLYPSPGYDEGWSQAEWRNNKNISTFGQETIALGGSGNTYTWASSNYTYDSLLLTYSSSDPIGRIKIDTTDSSGTPIARPLIGVAYTLSTDGKKNRAQLMTPASYCSWTMKVPVYYAGTQNY